VDVLPGEVPIAYTEVPGRGVPVLLLHGFGSGYDANWVRAGWPHALDGLAHIGVDLRGHGGSGRPRDAGAYRPAAMAGDLERLLDALGVQRCDVLAYSMGSRIAWEFSLTRPDRVRRAVLGGFGPVDAFAGTDLDRLDAPDGGPFTEVFRAAAAQPGADPAALAACARGQAAHPFTADPAPAGVPLLFVAGEHDTLASGVEDLARAVGAAPAVRVPRRDHRTAVSARAFKTAAVGFLTRGVRPLSGV
jgi:pimeloyl-ACP methyl ester carboxylesterase